MFLFSDKIVGQCPTFEFCLSEPYYESLYGAFATDVNLNDFANYYAAGIDLEISYSNTDIHIIESTTEQSLLSVIKTGLGASFNFSAGGIILGGIQPPLDEGAEVTGFDEEIIFTIYFTAVAGECVDFTFVSTDVIVSFPLIPAYEICEGGVGLNCEIDDYCMPSFTLAGLIENPVLDCVDAEDGGVPGVLVEINEAQEIEDYDCMAITYANGDYECSVIGGLDYRITPIHDYNRSCGLTSLDIDIIQDHILQSDCITDLWSFLAADVNESGTITTSDNSAIQGAILNTDVDWPSWSFVPASTYTGLTIPTCPGMGSHVVPSYNEFIDIEELDDDLTQLDFVGIKMGDVNGTCTECSDAFTNNDDVFVRSAPVQLNIDVSGNQADFSFNTDINGLEVLMFAISCPYPPEIVQSNFVTHENNIMLYREGVFYISYVSQIAQGEGFTKNIPFLTLIGDFADVALSPSRIHNSIVIDNNEFGMELNPVQVLTHKIYPNPVSGNFTVTLPTGEIGLNMVFSIFDMFGRLQYEQVLSSQSTAIAINLQPGTYYYSVCNDKMNSSGKIIFE